MVTDGKTVGSPRQPPEEEELARLEARLAGLEEELADRELELATILRELRDFELRFLAIVGTRQAELDRLEARIAALLAVRDPSLEAEQSAAASAEQARQSAEELGDDPEALAQAASEPQREIPEDLKKLFRQVAKSVHPDLAADDADRVLRERQMVAANAAYVAGDVQQLRALLDDWQSRPEAVRGDDTGAQLVRALRRIAAVEKRLADLAAEIAACDEGSLAQLHAQAQAAQAEGRDLLQEMAAEVECRIAAATLRLRELADATEQGNG